VTSKALWFGFSHLLRGILLGVYAITLSGCGAIHSARMWFPKASGLDAVDARLYVEPVMSVEQRQEVQRQINIGRATVERFYGNITTTPYFIACRTTGCDDRFGSYGQRAAAYGDLAIRLSAKGWLAPLVAHEWSHAELYRRTGGWWYARKIPRWFDEGVAVVVADEPRHSEDNWREIQRRGLSIPQIGALISFSDWGDALKKYGETAGDVPSNLHVVYTVAGHEVRRFLSCSGPTGVVAVLDAVRSGSTFDDAYAMVSAKCAH
jgi:hypothetical protein